MKHKKVLIVAVLTVLGLAGAWYIFSIGRCLPSGGGLHVNFPGLQSEAAFLPDGTREANALVVSGVQNNNFTVELLYSFWGHSSCVQQGPFKTPPHCSYKVGDRELISKPATYVEERAFGDNPAQVYTCQINLQPDDDTVNFSVKNEHNQADYVLRLK